MKKKIEMEKEELQASLEESEAALEVWRNTLIFLFLFDDYAIHYCNVNTYKIFKRNGYFYSSRIH